MRQPGQTGKLQYTCEQFLFWHSACGMALSKTLRCSLLPENSYAKYSFLLKKKIHGIHPINQLRNVYGEFHHLYWQLRKYPERFFEYLRMSVETFDFILSRVSHRLQKQTTNYRQSISSAERLVVTIR
jgi:hypothetical protein